MPWMRGEAAEGHAAEKELSNLSLAGAPPSHQFDAHVLRTLLDERGFAVVDGVPLDAPSTCSELERFFGAFGGDTDTDTHNLGLRSDTTNSIRQDDCRTLRLPALSHALRMLYGLGHLLVSALDGSSGALTLPPHVQVARYQPGQSYNRHTDVVPADLRTFYLGLAEDRSMSTPPLMEHVSPYTLLSSQLAFPTFGPAFVEQV